MSFIGVGYGEVTLKWRPVTTTRDVTSVWGFKNNLSQDAPTLAAAIDGAMTGLNGLGAVAGFSSTYTWRGVRVVVERGSGPEIAEVNENLAGTLVADPVPPNCAVLVRKTTAVGGRRGRGRAFIPCIYSAELQVDSVGALSAAAVTAVQTRVNEFRTDMVTLDCPLYVLHSVSEVVPYAVVATPVQPLIATQRRRLRR